MSQFWGNVRALPFGVVPGTYLVCILEEHKINKNNCRSICVGVRVPPREIILAVSYQFVSYQWSGWLCVPTIVPAYNNSINHSTL